MRCGDLTLPYTLALHCQIYQTPSFCVGHYGMFYPTTVQMWKISAVPRTGLINVELFQSNPADKRLITIAKANDQTLPQVPQWVSEPFTGEVIVQCQEFHICKLRIMLLLHSALKPADEACACSVYCYVLPRPQLANQQHRMQFRKIVGESKLHLVLFQKVMFGKWSNQIYLLHCELRTKICYLCFWYKATCT